MIAWSRVTSWLVESDFMVSQEALTGNEEVRVTVVNEKTEEENTKTKDDKKNMLRTLSMHSSSWI